MWDNRCKPTWYIAYIKGYYFDGVIKKDFYVFQLHILWGTENCCLVLLLLLQHSACQRQNRKKSTFHHAIYEILNQQFFFCIFSSAFRYSTLSPAVVLTLSRTRCVTEQSPISMKIFPNFIYVQYELYTLPPHSQISLFLSFFLFISFLFTRIFCVYIQTLSVSVAKLRPRSLQAQKNCSRIKKATKNIVFHLILVQFLWVCLGY